MKIYTSIIKPSGTLNYQESQDGSMTNVSFYDQSDNNVEKKLTNKKLNLSFLRKFPFLFYPLTIIYSFLENFKYLYKYSK